MSDDGQTRRPAGTDVLLVVLAEQAPPLCMWRRLCDHQPTHLRWSAGRRCYVPACALHAQAAYSEAGITRST